MRLPQLPAQFDVGGKCRRLFGPNGDLKVLSVVVSAVFIVLVHQQVVAQLHERTFTVPVLVKSDNETMAVSGYEPASVEITLRGTQDEIAALDPSRLAVELLAQNMKSLKREALAIRVSNILGTGNLKIVNMEPNKVEVAYDEMVEWPTDRVAAPKLDGTPVSGYAEVEMPTSVTVKVHGAKSKISAFRDKRILLPTSPVNVDGKTESFDATVAITVPQDSGITKVEPSTVRVRVNVTTKAEAGAAEDSSPLRRVGPGGAAEPAREDGGSAEEAREDGGSAEAPDAGGAPDGIDEGLPTPQETALPPPVEIHDTPEPPADG